MALFSCKPEKMAASDYKQRPGPMVPMGRSLPRGGEAPGVVQLRQEELRPHLRPVIVNVN